MNKPIRCTTHFHACDCREYEFEKLQEENEELKKVIESLKDNLMLMLASYGDNTRTEKLIKDSLTVIKGEVK